MGVLKNYYDNIRLYNASQNNSEKRNTNETKADNENNKPKENKSNEN